MGKWSKEITEKGTNFLDNSLNARGDYFKLKEDFRLFLLDKLKKRELTDLEIEEIITDYSSIYAVVGYSFEEYQQNVDLFEIKTLQVNSVISTSLMLEYRIHDILFNKDLILESTRKELEKPYFFYDYVIETLEKLKERTTDVNNLKEIEGLLTEAIQYSKDAKKQKENDYKRINKLKEDEYYIGTMSQEKNLISLLNDILIYYVSNDILKGVRESILKDYDVAIEKDILKRLETKHCLKVGAFKITQNKIANLMKLSLQNEGGNVIDNKALKMFSLLINLEDEAKKEEYKKALKKCIALVTEDVEEEQGIRKRGFTLEYMARTRAKELLQEMEWCDFEEKK